MMKEEVDGKFDSSSSNAAAAAATNNNSSTGSHRQQALPYGRSPIKMTPQMWTLDRQNDTDDITNSNHLRYNSNNTDDSSYAALYTTTTTPNNPSSPLRKEGWSLFSSGEDEHEGAVAATPTNGSFVTTKRKRPISETTTTKSSWTSWWKPKEPTTTRPCIHVISSDNDNPNHPTITSTTEEESSTTAAAAFNCSSPQKGVVVSSLVHPHSAMKHPPVSSSSSLFLSSYHPQQPQNQQQQDSSMMQMSYTAMSDDPPQPLNPSLQTYRFIENPEPEPDGIMHPPPPPLGFFYDTTTTTSTNPNSPTKLNGQYSPRHHHNKLSLFRSMRRTHRHAELFAYTDAVHVFPPTFLNRYRIRYNELNKEFRSETRHYDEYRDLQLLEEEESQHYSSFHHPQYHPELDEEQGGHEYYNHLDGSSGGSNHHRHVVTTATQSSLFTKIGNTIVLQLPRDQVRLLMDPDLPPGILSVEQWRTPPNEMRIMEQPLLNGSAHTKKTTNEDPEQQWPPLRYVLTVEEDLYRKMVDEMSGSTLFPPHEEEKVDIRVAYTILGIILLILFVNTMAFEEK